MRCSRTRTTLTGPIEVPSSRHIIHNTLDGKQYPLALLSVERDEGLRGVGLVEKGRRVGLGHPCVPVLEFVRDALGHGVGGEDDPLDGVEDIEQERGVHRCSEVEGHLAGRRRGRGRGRDQRRWLRGSVIASACGPRTLTISRFYIFAGHDVLVMHARQVFPNLFLSTVSTHGPCSSCSLETEQLKRAIRPK